MKENSYVYFMTNKYNTRIYTGVTSDLVKRVYEHRNKLHKDSFTARYNLTKLVYYEIFDDINFAIAREKQIKGGSKEKKRELVKSFNFQWNDLYEEICVGNSAEIASSLHSSQ